jgi:hypothetical protein
VWRGTQLILRRILVAISTLDHGAPKARVRLPGGLAPQGYNARATSLARVYGRDDLRVVCRVGAGAARRRSEDRHAGTTPALTLTTIGFFDLSQVTPSQIAINPREGVSGLRVSNASPRSMILSFDLSAQATAGQRTLSIEANDVTVLIKFMVERAPPPVCSPRNCRAPNTCVNGVCTPPPPPVCSPANCRPPRRCEDGVCVRPPPPPVCSPRCRPPRICEDGRCVIPQ